MPKQALPQSDEDRLLIRHILDLAERSERSKRVLFSNFLDDRQLAICEAALKSVKLEYLSYGGYERAERRVLAFGGEPEFWELPFSAAVFNYPAERELSHRDFLGSLMSLGIKRELLGDILVGDGRTSVFVINSALPLVKDITKIGSVGVRISEDFSLDDIPEQRYDEIKTTVASLRLDSIIASGLSTSREKAAELIKTKGVSHNRVMSYAPAERVSEGDMFSVRGFGKFILKEVGGMSRKDRVFITLLKYR